MTGKIHYSFYELAIGGQRWVATLESNAYSKGVIATGDSHKEARGNLIDKLLNKESPSYVPPDEEIEF